LPPPTRASILKESGAQEPAGIPFIRPPFVGRSSVDLSKAATEFSYPDPTSIDIPAIGVRSSVVALGRNANGSAAVPSGTTFTGWYDLGPKPGELGPAVIIGHVDSYSGPGVFFNLKLLLPGDVVRVTDGSVLVLFRVQRVETYPKNTFPTAEIFGTTPDAELRLVTCGGPFDQSIGHYEDNVVIYASAI
jgi:sortase (surface protein transpeptidase)